MSDVVDYRILVVDDDDASRLIITDVLKWDGYSVEQATSGEHAIELMKTWDPHVVLLDMDMPGLSGIETLAHLRKKENYVSVMFVSARSGTDDIIRGLDAGADDYICKPFDPTELLARVRAQLRIVELTVQLFSANHQLKQMVDTDDLTGLFNMRSLYTKLEHEMDRGRRFKRAVVAVMMDIDNFKTVNDNNDHLFGSYVLTQVGQIIKDNIRTVDLAARYGGDEFLVILTETNREGANSFCERLRKKIETTKFEQGENSIELTTSMGFAITNPESADIDGRALVRAADRALYDAKHAGKNCVRYYDMSEDDGEVDGTLMRRKQRVAWRK